MPSQWGFCFQATIDSSTTSTTQMIRLESRSIVLTLYFEVPQSTSDRTLVLSSKY
jgi:hypothetical protein